MKKDLKNDTRIVFCFSFEELINQSDENKDRVPFYMSIPATMKFIVRGKSVDFKNREGSSPSIPNKKKRAHFTT